MSIIYIVVLTYIKPIEDVDSQMSEHVEWLKKGYSDGVFLASGRRIPRNGGVILAKCDDIESLKARLSQDPFQTLGIAKTEIIPFEATMKAHLLDTMF
ncbi:MULTISPECIES: YciI family protein [Enterobacterales]|uniref:YciI family protein n=1 Tax=Enterobacterales TaxID=91347 RepID=UPI002EDAB0BE